MKTYAVLAFCTILSYSLKAQFSQPGELDTTFNFGKPHSFFSDFDNPQPGVGANGHIYSIVRQQDGKVLIGGEFSRYNDRSRSGIARLNTDGSLDPSFNPGLGVGGIVYSLILQSDGKVLIGGMFNSYNGISRNCIARLNIDGSLDSSFDPGLGANADVRSIIPYSNGKVVLGGKFTSFNGIIRNGLARLNVDGSLDISFNPGTGISGGANTIVHCLATQTDGKMIIGGDFTSYNGISRNRIARLFANGDLDVSFNPGFGANGEILSLALQPNGKVLIGGSFSSYNSNFRPKITRLNSDASLDASFSTGSLGNGSVYSIIVLPNGKLIIGGSFSTYNGTACNGIARLNINGGIDLGLNLGIELGGVSRTIRSISRQLDGKILIGGEFVTSFNLPIRNKIFRINIDGSTDSSFNTSIGGNDDVYSLALQPDGKVLVAGPFILFDGTSRNSIVRYNSNGTLDKTFNAEIESYGSANMFVSDIAIQPDGKMIFVGNVGYNGFSYKHITRLNTDGSLDTTFNPGTGTDGQIYSVAIQPDGKVLIAGSFNNYNGLASVQIARLNTDGKLDTSFSSGAGPDGIFIQSLALQADGKILIGGSFSSYNGSFQRCIARLLMDGRLDTTFNPGLGTNNSVRSLAVQSDGKTLIGGDFVNFNNVARNRIARLNIDGSLDTSFNPGTGAEGTAFYTRVYSIGIQPDGKVIIAGNFEKYNNTSSNQLARLNQDGSLDTTFKSEAEASKSINEIALQPDGNLLIGGNFTSYNGIYRPGIARLKGGEVFVGIPIEEIPNRPQTYVYPVPFLEELKINANGPFQYEVLNVNGVVKITGTTFSLEAIIKTNNLSSGIYLVRVTINGHTQVHKVVKD